MPAYDPTLKRRAKRSQRERGCWTYIPAEVLGHVSMSEVEPIFYKVHGSRKRKGAVLVQLYPDADG